MNEQNTALWERRLGDGLNALIDGDAEVPAPTVTVADLIAAGREARRRRRRTAFAISAVLVVATALSLGTVLGTAHQGSVAPPVSRTPSRTAGSDPASPTITFGWLPTDLRGEYQVEQNALGPGLMQTAGATTALSAETEPGTSGVQIWNLGNSYLYAFIGSGNNLHPSVPAGTVQGHQAWWFEAPGSSGAATAGRLLLMWQYKPTEWAAIDYTSSSTDASTGAMVLKVADNLVIGPPHAYAMPFRMPRMPAGLHSEAVLISLDQKQDAQYGNAALRLCVADGPCAKGGLVVSQVAITGLRQSMLNWSNAPQIDPFTGQFRPGSGKPSTQSATIDGTMAQLWTTADSATLLFGGGQSSVMVSAAGAEYDAIGGTSGLIAFANSMTWYGDAPSQWSTDVIG